MGSAPAGRLLFVSYHCYADTSSGAAVATRDLLSMLTARGWDARVLSGPTLDFERRESLPQLLAAQDVAFEERRCAEARPPFSVFHFRQNAVRASVYCPGGSRQGTPDRAEGANFLALLDCALAEFRPHVVLTYGGHWLGRRIVRCARLRGAAVVFALHNFEYREPRLFDEVDAVLVPSQFCAEHYRNVLGLCCAAIPSPIDWGRVRCSDASQRRYVTFVNPQPHKGVFVFARIAEQLGRLRPGIPLLVVEARAEVGWLGRCGVDLSRVQNLHVMANTPDPRDIYRASRVVLMPSLWRESFGRVAAEALINGIPVVASRRGALPEVLRGAGILLDIPAYYTPASQQAPTDAEVAPWVEAIIRLWDDPAFYVLECRRCAAAAEAWRPDRLAGAYDAFFRSFTRPESACVESGQVAALPREHESSTKIDRD